MQAQVLRSPPSSFMTGGCQSSVGVKCTHWTQSPALMKKIKDTPEGARLRELHGALLEIVGVMNQPQRDAAMILEAGISLERAQFPLLVLVERFGPIGVVELADRVGRDYTTVSRQVAKLEGQGLVSRRESAADRRVREAVITRKGKTMTDKVDEARKKIGFAIFSEWKERDLDALVRLMCKFADDLKRGVP
ncbi:MarR family winged helix-turn-helix transcriptional regulator [Xanthomonas hortorum]|uniref:MarR family winged helix-turn-helix transcriptional regulator n=1 Tax=Xanthomonas hortorum TaxID=56454 RepID=UPI001F4CA708|nr:MarR family winged helix-turn-helix transcriptional regulator [Xanthomonas hortorum]